MKSRTRTAWVGSTIALVLFGLALGAATTAADHAHDQEAPKKEKKPVGYTIITQYKGRIGCEVGTPVIQSPELCDRLSPTAATFDYKAPVGTTAIRLTLEWAPSTQLGANTLELTPDKTLGGGKSFESKSPNTVVFDPVPATITEKGNEGTVFVDVGRNSGVALDQLFALTIQIDVLGGA